MWKRSCGPRQCQGAGRGWDWKGDLGTGPFWFGFGPRRGGPRGGRMFEQGDLKFVILQLLADKPRHGYEIIKDLEERSGGRYSPSPGTVYPTLTLLEDMGYGRITGRQVLTFLLPDEAIGLERPRRSLRTLFGLLGRGPRPLVMVEDIDQALIRFGKCCQPLAGEDIVGFLSRGHGVTVHAKACPRAAEAASERMVAVSWQKGANAPRPARIEVVSRDRPRLLADMTQAIASAGVNIERAHVRTVGNKAMNAFEVTLSSVEDLDRVMRNLRRLSGVQEVRRVIG